MNKITDISTDYIIEHIDDLVPVKEELQLLSVSINGYCIGIKDGNNIIKLDKLSIINDIEDVYNRNNLYEYYSGNYYSTFKKVIFSSEAHARAYIHELNICNFVYSQRECC
jgi:hypothetical protein